MKATLLAVDLGGSKIAGALVTSGGEVRHVRTVPTPRSGLEPLMDQLMALIEELLAHAEGAVRGIGLAVPGIVEADTGTAVVAANLPWQRTPLAEIVSRRTGVQTIVGNDADGATLAERWFGAATACRTYICMTIGTGIGGGVVIDGKLLRGAHGSGAEIGHMIVDTSGPRCRCGSPGCLEVLAAGPAIAARMRALGGTAVNAKSVIDAARSGDPLAERVLSDTAAYLAIAVVNLWRLFEPELLVLGGGVAAAGDLILQPLLGHIERLTPTRAFPYEAVRCSTIHQESSFLAAASLVLEAEAEAAATRPTTIAASAAPVSSRRLT